MPDDNFNQDKVADYSNYFKQEQPPVQKDTKAVSPLQEIPYTPKFTRRAKLLIAVLLLLLATQIFLLFSWQNNTTPEIPSGYQLITPPNQPAYLEKVK